MTMADANDRIEEIEELFEQNDADGNGDIDFEEFTSFMSELDPQMPAAALEIGFRDIDTNKDGRINFDEFIAWWLAD
jgi:calmodulin